MAATANLVKTILYFLLNGAWVYLMNVSVCVVLYNRRPLSSREIRKKTDASEQK